MKPWRIILVVLVLAAALVACDWDWWNVSSGDVYQHVTMQADATATEGARLFHIQLTAIATEESEK